MGFANRASCTGGKSLEAGNGQPTPPALRVRVDRCPPRCVPASVSVISPPPCGDGASGTRWAHFEWGNRRELEITGNARKAAATASRLYQSRRELPTPPLTNPRERADRTSARNSPQRTPQVARSAVAPSCSRTTFREMWQSRNRMGLWSGKACTCIHLGAGPLSESLPYRVRKTHERGVLCGRFCSSWVIIWVYSCSKCSRQLRTWLKAARCTRNPGCSGPPSSSLDSTRAAVFRCQSSERASFSEHILFPCRRVVRRERKLRPTRALQASAAASRGSGTHVADATKKTRGDPAQPAGNQPATPGVSQLLIQTSVSGSAAAAAAAAAHRADLQAQLAAPDATTGA